MRSIAFAVVATLLATTLLAGSGACFLPELREAPEPADPCTTCASTACSAESSACFEDTACAQLLECVLACDPAEEGCADVCLSLEGAAEGLPLAIPVAECTSVNCADVCPGVPGFGAGGMGGTGGTGGMGGMGGMGGTGGTGGTA